MMTFLVYSCTEKMDIVLPTTYTRLIVDARITTDTTAHRVLLSKTASYFDNSPPLPVTGAIITIDDGNTTYPLTENILTPGLYQTAPNVYGVVGKTYNLIIKNVDVTNSGVKQVFTASTTINHIVKLDSIQVKYNTDNPNRKSHRVYMYAQDPPTLDFYTFRIYKNGVLMTDSLNKLRFTDDRLFNGNYMLGLPIGNLSDNRAETVTYPGDTITVELSDITKDYFNFLVGVQAAVAPQIPLFSGPPANVKGNVNNGAFGFFSGYSSSRASSVVIQ